MWLMLGADAWGTIGSVASVVAAGAALVTVWFARRTVVETREGRSEARDAHAAEAAHQERLLDATTQAHEREMHDRERAAAAELALQRLVQIGRVIELLGETADIARLEIATPPQPILGQIGTWTRVTGALARVEAAVAILERLGGPALPEVTEMTLVCRRVETPRERVVAEAMAMLARAQHVAATDKRFDLPSR